MPSVQISNPSGAFGYTDLKTEVWSLTAPFVASATITGPCCVAIDTTGNSVATAATNGTAALVVGIFTGATLATSAVGLVVVQGMAENVPVNGAVAAGDPLKRSVTTAGRVATTATPGVGECVGFAINASAGGTVDVWVSKSI